MRRLLAVALTAAYVLPGATASAHEGDPNYRSDVRGLTPRTEGVTVEVLNRDDRLLITNRSDETIVIDGYSDDPYARLLPDGTVQVNRNSAATYLNEDRFAEVAVPERANRDLAPDWQTVSGTGRFEWHDHRMHWMARSVPPVVTDRSKLTKVDDWSVPITVGGRRGAIAGTLWWTPQDGGGPPAAALAALAALILGGGALVLVRRRRRQARGPVEAW